MNTLCSMRRKKRPRRLPSGTKNLSFERNSLTTYQVLQSLCCYLIVATSTVREVSILECCVSMLSFCVYVFNYCAEKKRKSVIMFSFKCHFHSRSCTVRS